MKYTSQHGPCVVSIHVGRDVQLKIYYLIIISTSLYGIACKSVSLCFVWCCVAIAVLVNQL